MSSDFLHTLARLAEPWQAIYADSSVLSIIILFGHLGALLLGGGFAVALDRSTLLAARGDSLARSRHLDLLRGAHPFVIVALVLLWISGLLMAAAEVKTFLVSPWFWLKMGAVTLLMINGIIIVRTGDALYHRSTTAPLDAAQQMLWKRLRVTAILSMALWFGTTLIGIILSETA